MQLSALIAEAGGTPQALEPTGRRLARRGSSGRNFRLLTGIKITVRGKVDGLDDEHSSKPLRMPIRLPGQQGLTGVDMALDAALES